MNLLNAFSFLQNIDYEILINVTLAGLVIVFGMLILLVIIITIFGVFMSLGKRKSKAEAPKAIKKTEKSVTAVPKVVVSNDDDDELIAVISAAVYSMYEGTGIKPVIKSVRPSAGVNPWKYAGVRQNMRSFF